jgi:cell division protein FtsI (penicillin-binding protein 3)
LSSQIKMHHQLKKRIYASLIIFAFLFCAILAKAFLIQVINRKKFISYSESQTLRSITRYPNRGTIKDRNGEPLAINVAAYDLFTFPQSAKNLDRELRVLNKIVPELNFYEMKSSLKGRDRFTWLSRGLNLTNEQMEKIKNLKSIFVERTSKRVYPNGSLLAHTIGYVGTDTEGRSGIEYKFDEYLRGKVEKIQYVRDAKGRPIKFESSITKPVSNDLQLTIDKNIQAYAEKLLKEAVTEHNALRGGVGVIDPTTGEILAMANYPTFDPNFKLTDEDLKNSRLSFISDPFEPGSTFKVVTVASALINNIATPETNFYCEKGRFKVDSHYITEADGNKPHEWLSVEEIIRDSSNIGVTKLAFDIGYEKLKETIVAFKINEKTGIDLPAESRGIFNDSKKTSALNLSNVSFGQGIALTGLQMMMVYSTIANNGIYMPPKIDKNFSKQTGFRVIDPHIATMLNKMLVKAVKDGTGKNASVPYFSIAGKTSTAQKPSKSGGYENYISGFIGFPNNVKKPFVISVYIDEPKGKEYYGGLVAAPVFKKLAQYMLFRNKEYQELSIAKDEIANMFNDKVSLTSSSAKIAYDLNSIPDFSKLDKTSALKLAERYKIKLTIKGIGIVAKQFPSPGTIVSENTVVHLNFFPPSYD